MNHNDLLHRVLAFYGFKFGNGVWQRFYEWSMALFERYGCRIWKIGPAGKMLKVKNALRRIEQQGCCGFDELTICSLPDDLQDKSEGEWRMFSEVCCLTAVIAGRIGVCFVDIDSTVESTDVGLISLAEEITSFLRPQYGILYRRISRLCPSCYAYGLPGPNVKNEEDALRISRWKSGYWNRVFLKGQIRDVYPSNFLNQSHLDFPVDRLRFYEWVIDAPGRGVLKPFTKSLTLWEVPDSDIPKLQESLAEAGMIYDYMKTVPQYEGPDVSSEEALGKVLDAFDIPKEEAAVLKKGKGGQLRELSPDELRKIPRKGKGQ